VKSIKTLKENGDGEEQPKTAILKHTPMAVLKTRKNAKRTEKKTVIAQVTRAVIPIK
jgi:hypothetical protein